MKIHYLFFVLLLPTLASGADVCVTCEVKGLPSDKPFLELAQLSKDKIKPKNDPIRKIAATDKERSIEGHCLLFNLWEKNQIGTLIREMEKTPYGVDENFLSSLCQMTEYPERVRAPMIHYVAESPESREDFLRTISLYYIKKRKQPEVFTQVLNFQNTEGETILDYIETLKLSRQSYTEEVKQGSLKRIENFICLNGGVYKKYPNKKCEGN